MPESAFLIKLQASGCQFRKNCKNTLFLQNTSGRLLLNFVLNFGGHIQKNEILGNTTVQIDRSVSWFNDFEVFLLHLEKVLYL